MAVAANQKETRRSARIGAFLMASGDDRKCGPPDTSHSPSPKDKLARMGTNRLLIAFLAASTGALGFFGCGASGSSDVGFAEISSSDAGEGAIDWDAGVWPDSDPSPNDPSAGDPSFSDGGPPAPSQFTCSGKSGNPGNRTLSLQSSGLNRVSVLHVPASYDPTEGTPLVLNFHGFTSDGWQQQILTRMDATSEARGFIVAYPSGIAASWNAGQCCGTAWLDAVDDIQLVKDLIAKVSEEYCIDPKRIYATGMSNGGFIAHRIGCELADTIAAIAPVAGVLGVAPGACNPSRPMPVLHFHGTSDPLVPYGGGYPVLKLDMAGTLNFRSVKDTVQTWRNLNGCIGEPEILYAKADAICERWSDCSPGAEVTLCTIDRGGHTWPGGVPIPMGKTSSSISATETMADFFEVHRLP